MPPSRDNGAGERPVIFDYETLPVYLKDMLAWRKQAEPAFSIRAECATIRRCSPALVSQVASGVRRLTEDRVPAFADLLALNPEEKSFLKQWVLREGGGDSGKEQTPKKRAVTKRRASHNHLICDWLNVYVKDASRLRGFAPDPVVIRRLLGGIASESHIRKSLDFLLREGYLRRDLEGKIVENETLVTTTNETPSDKIKRFHLRALDVAKRGMTLYPVNKRQQLAVVLPLNESSVGKLKQIIQEFYEELLVFAEEHAHDTEQLHQVIINLSPVGGTIESD